MFDLFKWFKRKDKPIPLDWFEEDFSLEEVEVKYFPVKCPHCGMYNSVGLIKPPFKIGWVCTTLCFHCGGTFKINNISKTQEFISYKS